MDNNTTSDYFYDEISSDNDMLYLLTEPHEILALVLSGIGISMNILSLLAISQIKNRITTHHRLIISLCMSDILIDVSVCLSVINAAVNPYYESADEWRRIRARCLFMVIKALNSMSLNISLFNLMMMAFDHFVAIIRPLHYPLHMRKKRSIIIILALWGISFVLGFSDFLTGFNKYYFEESMNYCDSVYLSLYNDEYAVFVIAGLTMIIMFYIYTRIYMKIRALQQPGVKVKEQQSNPSDLRRNKRALITTLLILGTFILFWMPMCIYQITLIILVNFGSSAVKNHLYLLITFDRYLYNLLQLNAISDPIIYAVRMYEVQLGYKRMFRRCFPCFSKNRALNIPFYESAKENPRSNGSKSSVRHNGDFLKPLDQATTHSEYLMITKRSELPESNADEISAEQEHQFS